MDVKKIINLATNATCYLASSGINNSEVDRMKLFDYLAGILFEAQPTPDYMTATKVKASRENMSLRMELEATKDDQIKALKNAIYHLEEKLKLKERAALTLLELRRNEKENYVVNVNHLTEQLMAGENTDDNRLQSIADIYSKLEKLSERLNFCENKIEDITKT